MATKAELDFRELLLNTGVVQPVKVAGKGGKLSALCRLVPGQESIWLRALESLLKVGAEQGVEFHVCKRFVLKDDRMVAGWHVGIETKPAHLKDALAVVQLVLQDVHPELIPVELPRSRLPSTEPESGEEAERELSPAQQQSLAERRKEYRRHTTAAPRPADHSLGHDVTPPPGFMPELRIVFRGQARDQRNNIVPVIVEEFPIPHVYVNDMNKPNEKGRGATGVA